MNDAATKAGLPQSTIELVSLRAGQINGCAVCLDMHGRGAHKTGETDERLLTLATWRDTPYFNEAERAALALTEAGTRLADRSDPVPDSGFEKAAEHYDEEALGALVVAIAARADVEVLVDETGVVEHFAMMARDNHQFAKFNGIGLDQRGDPHPDDLHLAWVAGARVALLIPR